MNQNKRLYLNSGDSTETFNNDGKFTLDLSNAHLHAPSGTRMKMKLIRCELPSTTCIGTFNDNQTADDFNLKLSFEYTAGGSTNGFTIFFNPQINLGGADSKVWNLQTTIIDVLGYINQPIQSPGNPVIGVDTDVSEIGLNRLKLLIPSVSLTFLTGETSIEILRALGLNIDLNTTITDSSGSPRNFDLTQVLPNIIISSNLNFNSFSTTSVSNASIIEVIPTAMTQDVNYITLLSTLNQSGSTTTPVSYKLGSSLVYESTQSGKTIGNTSVDRMTIELLSPQNKKVVLAQNKASLVIEVEFVK